MNQSADTTQEITHTRLLTDDAWSVDSGYDDVSAIPKIFFSVVCLMLAPIKIAVAHTVATREQYENAFLACLTGEFNKEIASYCLAINTNSTMDWYAAHMKLIDENPELRTEPGWLAMKHNELNATLVNELKERFGIDKLEGIIQDLNTFLASIVPITDESPALSRITAEVGFGFNERDVWYPTPMLKVLIRCLPNNYFRLVLSKARLHARSTNEIIELINAAPDHITEINISGKYSPYVDKKQLKQILAGLRNSSLVLKLRPTDFGVEDLSKSELNDMMQVMPPRTYLRIKNMPVDCCLQSKARALLYKTLPLIETETFKIPDAVLSKLLNDEIRLLHLIDMPTSEFIRHLAAHKLFHDVLSIVDANEHVFNYLSIPSDVVTSDTALQQFIHVLENYKTPLSSFCCALLLAYEIDCYWDESKDNLDAE